MRIRQVTRESGISPHTLRAWERRHDAVRPGRGGGGHREYSAADVDRLRMLRELVARGGSIGVLASLDSEELARRLNRPQPGAAAIALLHLLEGFRAAEFETRLGRERAQRTPGAFALEVALPLLARLGDGVERGQLSIAHEHLASSLLRDHLLLALRTIPVRSRRRGTAVLATLEGDQHELGVLCAAVLAAEAGFAAYALGPSLPEEEIARVALALGARLVVVGVNAPPDRVERDPPEPHLEALAARLVPGARLIVGGRGLVADWLPRSSRIRRLETVADLVEELAPESR